MNPNFRVQGDRVYVLRDGEWVYTRAYWIEMDGKRYRRDVLVRQAARLKKKNAPPEGTRVVPGYPTVRVSDEGHVYVKRSNGWKFTNGERITIDGKRVPRERILES